MRRVSIVFRREFSGYFATPLAAIFLVVFLFLASMFAFNIGGFFDRGQADLRPFFQFHPWLYLFLVPAISMRLWAEERRTGTIELIATLPLTMQDLVLGKFFAAWAFSGLAASPHGAHVVDRFISWGARPRCHCVLVPGLLVDRGCVLGHWERHQQPDQKSSGGVCSLCGRLLLALALRFFSGA